MLMLILIPASRLANEQREAEDAAGVASTESAVAEMVLHSTHASNQAASAQLANLHVMRQQAQDAAVQARQDVLALEVRVDTYEHAHSRGAAANLPLASL